MPFLLGDESALNVIHLRDQPVAVTAGDVTATYFFFLHAAEDIVTNYLDGFADTWVDGNEMGAPISDYVIEYADGERLPCRSCAASPSSRAAFSGAQPCRSRTR